jgi:uncharacterized protein (DUF58 family)
MTLRPTALGIKGIAFFAVIEVAYLATPYSNLFFLLLAFLAVLGVVGTVCSLRNVHGIAGEILGVGMAPAGDPHDVSVRLRCRGLRGRLRIRGRVAGQWHDLADLPLAEGGSEAVGRLAGLPRGVHALDALRIGSAWPFGILASERTVAAAGEVVAYPRPLGDAQRTAPDGPLAELAARRHGAAGTEVAGLRAFRTGDALRHVHWRASARRGSPVVREYEPEANEALEVVVDRRCAPETLEPALGAVTTLLLEAGERKTTVRIASQGHVAVYGPGQRTTAEGLRWLAQVEPLPAAAPPPPAGSAAALRLPGRSAGRAAATPRDGGPRHA